MCSTVVKPSTKWAASSAGRALRSQCRGRGFDPPAVHQHPPAPWNFYNGSLRRRYPAILDGRQDQDFARALPPDQFGSCSVDFRLGEEFSVFEHSRHALIDLPENRHPGSMRPSRSLRAIHSSCSRANLHWPSPRKRWSWTTTSWDGSRAGRAWAASGLSCTEPPGCSIQAGAAKRRSSSATWA